MSIVGFTLGCVAGATFYVTCQPRALWVPTGLAFAHWCTSVLNHRQDNPGQMVRNDLRWLEDDQNRLRVLIPAPLSMDVALYSALAALAGSGLGGLTAGVTTWITQRTHTRANQLTFELSRREDLYRDFIVEASNVYADALTKSEPCLHDLVRLYAMIGRMRILSSPQIIEIAEKIMAIILDTVMAPNKSVPELRRVIFDGANGIDPLKEFSETVRDELQLLQHGYSIVYPTVRREATTKPRPK